MTIKELTKDLTAEFEDYAKGCNLEKYTYYDEIAEGFSDNYFGDKSQAESFLSSLEPLELLNLLDYMPNYYGYDALVMNWVHNPQRLANAIIDYVVKTNVVTTINGLI